jgi:hypothetical protein
MKTKPVWNKPRPKGLGKPTALTPAKKAKRAGKAKGKQFVAQPKKIAKKTAGFR